MKRYHKTERGGGLFSVIEHEQALAAKTTGILKLRYVIAWEGFRSLLEDLSARLSAWLSSTRSRHLINLRKAGLPYIQLGASVRYDFDEVMKYLKTNRRLSSHIERRKRHVSPEPR